MNIANYLREKHFTMNPKKKSSFVYSGFVSALILMIIPFGGTKPSKYELSETSNNLAFDKNGHEFYSSDGFLSATQFSNKTKSGKRFIGFNLHMNFLDFIEHCHKNGMQPAEVISAEENAVLTSYLDGNFPAPKYFWLGGSDIGREGRYYWIASLTEFRYTSWYPGYPNGGIDENCATIYGGDGTWYDQYCTNDGVQPLCQTSTSV